MKIYSFSSGKGGVGKTTIVANTALAMAQLKKRVLILDGDLAMSNIDIVFGIKTKKSLFDFMRGDSLQSCITSATENLDILSGGNGITELIKIDSFQRRELIDQVQRLQFKYDYVLIDNSPGLHDYVLHLNAIADHINLILTSDPSSFADAYSLVKILNQKFKITEFNVITNLVKKDEGHRLFIKFSDVVEKFLSLRLKYVDSIVYDENLKRIQQQQRLILKQGNQFQSSSNFLSLARLLIDEKNANSNLINTDANQTGLSQLFKPATGHA